MNAAEEAAGALSPMFTSTGPRIGQPAIATGTTVSAIAAQASQATGRHRREGSAPVGNNSSKKVKVKTMPGGHAQVEAPALVDQLALVSRARHVLVSLQLQLGIAERYALQDTQRVVQRGRQRERGHH